MSYLEEMAKMVMQPETHFAFIWGMWVIGQLRHQGKRLTRVEKALGLNPIAPPKPIEFKRKRKNTGEGL